MSESPDIVKERMKVEFAKTLQAIRAAEGCSEGRSE